MGSMMDAMMGRDRGGMMGGMMDGGMMRDRMMDGQAMSGGMMRGGMMGGGMMGPAQGEKMHIATFRVPHGPRQHAPELALLRPAPAPEKALAELHTQLAFRHMRGFLNGREFEMDTVASDERLPVGRATVWTFANDGGGMPMPHPMHIHGVRFRVLERTGNAAPADLREGVIDAGFKDTFLIFPGERVRVHLVPTEPGLFMYHCHNLEHEDSGMMRNCSFDV
jgi:bilirubin oxidase